MPENKNLASESEFGVSENGSTVYENDFVVLENECVVVCSTRTNLELDLMVELY